MAIDINMRPTTILVGLLIVGAVVWSSIYLAAALTQVLFLLIFIGILAILWGVGERAKKRLTGERRRGGK